MRSREKRIELTMAADISDGILVFGGNVSNASLKGLMIRNVPRKFNFNTPKWIAVINSTGKNFKLLMNPHWSKVQGKYMDIGFQIVSPPLKWIRFINELDNQEIAV
jgi:hypothetical protein